MISCEVLCRNIETYVDGELEPSTELEFETHFAECGPCRVQLDFARTFRQQLVSALATGGNVPSSLADRIRGALDQEDERQAPSPPPAPTRLSDLQSQIRLLPYRARYGIPAAAALALVAFMATEAGNPASRGGKSLNASMGVGSVSTVLEDVWNRHLAEHPAEVQGSPTQVRGWFDGRLRFPVRVMDFDEPGARLVGARLSNVRDREAATFYYDVGGQRVTVVVFEPTVGAEDYVDYSDVAGQRVHFGRAHGYTIPIVQHDGLTYAITGEMDSRQILRLAARARVRN